MKRYSKILNQEIEQNERGIICNDGVKYSLDELKNIKNCNDETKRCLHKIKLMFNGEIIDALPNNNVGTFAMD